VLDEGAEGLGQGVGRELGIAQPGQQQAVVELRGVRGVQRLEGLAIAATDALEQARFARTPGRLEKAHDDDMPSG